MAVVSIEILKCATILSYHLKNNLQRSFLVSMNYYNPRSVLSTTIIIIMLLCHIIYTGNWDKLQYPFTRSVNPDVLQDIQDGKRYKQQSGHGKFFSKPEHAGLILCTDGVPLFKSSGKIVMIIV